MEPIIKPTNLQGGYSRLVSLPAPWVKEVGLKKHVKITQRGKKLIIEAMEE